MPEPNQASKSEALQISLNDLLLFLKKYFLIIIAGAIAFAFLGMAYSFTLPKLFTAQTVLLPEYNMGNNNPFINLAMGTQNGGAEKLVPDLYPNILTSTPFGQYLLKQPVVDQTGKKYPVLRDYLLRDTTQSFISRIFSFGKSEAVAPKKPANLPPGSILVLSTGEQQLISGAMGLINIEVDTKNGIITLECEMEDPVVAAMLVEASKNYLIRYVEDYRTSKMTEQSTFLEKRVKESKSRQQRAEYALQSYRDQNRNAYLNVARIEEQRLQSEYTLAQSIYSDLAMRLEQAKFKVKEEKPVFKILEPSKVPINKSSPKRFVIGFIAAVIGGLLTLFYIVFYKEKYHLYLFEADKNT